MYGKQAKSAAVPFAEPLTVIPVGRKNKPDDLVPSRMGTTRKSPGSGWASGHQPDLGSA